MCFRVSERGVEEGGAGRKTPWCSLLCPAETRFLACTLKHSFALMSFAHNASIPSGRPDKVIHTIAGDFRQLGLAWCGSRQWNEIKERGPEI